MNVNWERRYYGPDYWILCLTAEFSKKKVYRGEILYRLKASGPTCEFNFTSLGINGKKIDYTKTEEEMKKEALMFLKQKMETRINEYTLFCDNINSMYK